MQNRLYALMMATMLLFIALLSAAASSACALPSDTVIRFPDSNFEAEVREIIDKPTGEIWASDVAEITHLDVNDRGIADLTGIEYFTALKWLACDANKLAKLDVSQNTTLDWLDCSVNQLTALDVSLNPELMYLYCSDNQLTTLDVSHNPALTVLDCKNNQLTTLDLSQNLTLERFGCQNNFFLDKSSIIGLAESSLEHFLFYPQNDR